MLDKNDIKNLIKAMGEVFPIAEMVNNAFEKVATKEQLQTPETKVDKIDEKFDKLNAKMMKAEVRLDALENQEV